MRKLKKETQYELLKKEQLRAKELTLSEEYVKDINRLDELNEERTRWGMIQLELRRPGSGGHQAFFETMQEHHDHMNKGRKLKKEIEDLYDSICKKYSISRPVALNALKKIAGGLEQRGLRHRDEIPVKILTPQGNYKVIKDGYVSIALDSEDRFSIMIDPRGSKTDILHYVSSLLDCCAKNGIKNNTKFRDERLRDLEIYRLKALKTSFPKIATVIGMTAEAARKAFSRAYTLIHGKPYKAGTKARITKDQLVKECSTCKDRPTCKKLCPEAKSYANMDWKEEGKRFIGLIEDKYPDKEYE